jgi:Tfp pilus assembly protein PilF
LENSIYQNNLDALKQKYPVYYDKILSYENNDVELELKENNNFYGLSANVKGRGIVNINNSYNPQKEAQDVADDLELSVGEVRFVVGMGLGYLLKEISKREIKFLKIVIIEPYISVFKKALEAVDLTEEIFSDSFYFLLGTDFNLSYVFPQNNFDTALWVKGIKISFYEPERKINPELFDNIAKNVREQVGQYKMSVNTVAGTGPVFFENSMKNLTTTINSANLYSIKDIFKDKPVLVVGAGPSLKDDIEIIKKYQDYMAIFAVDTALPVLLKNGIKPDLAGAVDYHQISYTKYKDYLDQTKDVPFLYHNECASMIIKPYKSQVKFFVTTKYGLFSMLENEWDGWVDPPKMDAVPHLMLFAALFAGGSTIIFSGLDLGYVGFKSYADGASMSATLDFKSIIWAKGYKGESVATASQMVSQRMIIEDYIKNSNAKFYNSSKGVKISGAEKVEMEPFLNSLNLNKIPKKDIIYNAYQESRKPDKNKLIDILEKEIEQLVKLRKKFRKGKELAEKTQKISPKKINNYPQKVGAVCDYFDNESHLPLSVASVSQLLAKDELDLRCLEYNMNLEIEELSDNEKVLKEMGFIKKWFESRQKSVKKLLDIYKNLKSRLENELDLQNKINNSNNEKEKSQLLTKLGDVFLEFMDFVNAENAYKEALKYDENNFLAYAGLGKVFSRLLQTKKSLEFFKKAEELAPENKLIKNLLNQEENIAEERLSEARLYLDQGFEVYGANNRTHWAIRICKELLELNPENEKAKILKESGEKWLEYLEERNKEYLPVITKELNDALLYIEEISQEDLDKAIDFLEVLLAQNPGNPSILELLGIYNFNKKEISKAKNYLIQASSISNSPSPYIHLALINKSEGNYEQALYQIIEADRLAGNVPELKKAVAEVYILNKMYSEALDFYTQALKINGSDIEALQGLYECNISLENFEAANRVKSLIEKFNV